MTNHRRMAVRWFSLAGFPVVVGRRAEARWESLPAPLPGMRTRISRFTRCAAGLLGLLALTGCTSPAVRSQRLVAKPSMTFSAAGALQYNSSRLMGQQATGLAGAIGAQNSGCTSCR